MATPEESGKAGRAAATGISLAMKGIGGNLALASDCNPGLAERNGVCPVLWPWCLFSGVTIPAWVLVIAIGLTLVF